MQVIYTTRAQEDRYFWEKHDRKILHRIDQLIADIERDPASGLGRPEQLMFEKAGYWSRRINREHRLVYKVLAAQIYVIQCRYHY
ncbi:MAG: Txe/YoeB family addiction module toxin [Gammaproteobacteria bacterium]|nr:Txe/YoeB family addiction module toxin [Gammaproteobacteria bacterium]